MPVPKVSVLDGVDCIFVAHWFLFLKMGAIRKNSTLGKFTYIFDI